jgi:uncharacterized protein YidB (DUF937 family)
VEGALPASLTPDAGKYVRARITYMGLLDNLESLAGGASSGDHVSVATELMNAVQQHPGGLSGILQNFQQNGMAGHVDSWQQPNQENQPITPDQAQQGLGSGVIDSIAQRTGLSPTMVKGAAAVILPMMIAHFAQNGGVNQHPSALSGLASGFLSKFV